jgi:hypothetical protein
VSKSNSIFNKQRIDFEGTWQRIDTYTPIPNEDYYFDKFTFIKTPTFQKILAIENQDKKIKLSKDSGKVYITFRPFKRNSNVYSKLIELKTNENISRKLDSPEYTYYDPKLQNKIVMNMKLYDDQYEDQHHLITSLVLNLKTNTKQKVNLILGPN